MLLIIGALIASLFLAIFQYNFKKKERSQLHYWLSFFRFLSIFSILVLIINPSIQKKTVSTEKPNLLVAIDNSTSIKHSLQAKKTTDLITLLKNNSDLNSKFLIHYFSFGTQLKVLDSLNFTENQTNLEIPFKEFSSLFNEGINPVIVITDGNQTIGNSVEFTEYKNPVYPYIVGDTTITEDIYINQINVNKYTYINNKLPVEIFLNYSGKKDVEKALTIYQNKKKVYSKKIQFSTKKNVQSETFYLTSTSKGTQFYTVNIETLAAEKNVANNTKTFSINVIEEKSKILILTSIIHPDLGMLKKAIESTKQREVTISNITNIKNNLSEYQLVILYQPTSKFSSFFKEIKDKSLNSFIITGLSTDWNFLNNNQPYFSKKLTTQTENFLPVFNPDYTAFLSKDIGFSNFAPIEDQFGEITISIDYKTLLYQKIGSITSEKPLLISFENEGQKIAALFGENSWRWRMNSFNSLKNFEVFDGFLSNLIQYLSSNEKHKRLSVSIEPIYYANENVIISASYLDKNYNFDPRVKLWLTITNKETNYLKKIPFALINNTFNAELSGIPFGDYTYLVSVENQNETVSGNFKVLPFEVEQQFTNSNDKYLKVKASNTNGKIFYTNQENELISVLVSDQRFKSVQKSSIEKTPLINWKWLLALIMVSLSTEWFLRKYFGKI
jgi:hypothetical protein